MLVLKLIYLNLLQTIDAQLYNNVPDQPIYAKVNKKKRQPEVELHYAEIQMVQSSPMASRERQRPPQASTTEYATIDFNSTAQTKVPIYDNVDSADILIPPGALKMPNSKSHRKKGPSSEAAVLVWFLFFK